MKKVLAVGVYVKAGELFRAGKRIWTEADDGLLRARYPNEPTAAIARALRRSLRSVYARARLLGLKKSAAYLGSPAACRTNGRQGIGTRFEEGHVPANNCVGRAGARAG